MKKPKTIETYRPTHDWKGVGMKDTKQVDVWMGVSLMILSVFIWVLTADLPTPRRGIGPGDYPRFIAGALFVLGLVLFVTNIAHGYPKRGEPTDWRQLGRMALMAAMAFTYVRLLKPVGFPLLTPFFLFATMTLFGYRRWWKMVIISISSTAVIFLLFNVVFMVFLPVGRLF